MIRSQLNHALCGQSVEHLEWPSNLTLKGGAHALEMLYLGLEHAAPFLVFLRRHIPAQQPPLQLGDVRGHALPNLVLHERGGLTVDLAA